MPSTESTFVIRELEVTEPISRASTAYNSYSSPRHHLLYCTVCVRGITNVLAQCRFHRISKMTSSNPHPILPYPLGPAPSLHGLRSSPTFISLSLPPATRTLPHATSRSLSSSSTRERVPPPTRHPLTPSSLVLARPPARALSVLRRLPCAPACSALLSASLLCVTFFFLRPSFFHFPPSVPYELSTGAGFRRIKATAAAYYRRSVVPSGRYADTDQP